MLKAMISRRYGYPAARNGSRVLRGRRITMPDGVELAHDHYQPDVPGPTPVVLIRTPYGRRPKAGNFGLLLNVTGRVLAEQGYHVIIQDVRGRFDSGGAFAAFHQEAADGAATLDWVAEQPWCDGRVFTYGQSYLGYVQWAVADHPAVAGMLISTSSAAFHSIFYPDGVLGLDTGLRWAVQMIETGDPDAFFLSALFGDMARFSRRYDARLQRGMAHRPVAEADQLLTGEHFDFYQQGLANPDAESAFWREIDQRARREQTRAPVLLVGGWYDLLLRETVRDYAALRARGHEAYLTVGPWIHTDLDLAWGTIKLGIEWFDALRDERPLRDQRVRLYQTGEGGAGWREVTSWPPADGAKPLYLRADGSLGWEAGAEGKRTLPYDPNQPPPDTGCGTLGPNSGPVDLRELVQRADVITYEGPRLATPLELTGEVRAEIEADGPVYVRLCDVHPDGAIRPVSEGLGGAMWPVDHRFEAGHRMMVVLAGAAHPKWLAPEAAGPRCVTSPGVVWLPVNAI